MGVPVQLSVRDGEGPGADYGEKRDKVSETVRRMKISYSGNGDEASGRETVATSSVAVRRVSAFNAAGSSAYSNTLSLTTPAAPTVPAAPSGLTASARRVKKSVEVRLGWIDHASDETGYVVERCAGSSCTNFLAIAALPANTTSYTDRSVSRGITYRYRVMATGLNGNSGYTNIAAVTP